MSPTGQAAEAIGKDVNDKYTVVGLVNGIRVDWELKEIAVSGGFNSMEQCICS